MTSVRIAIPDASASRSKMNKKGWKCWAKRLTSVKSPARSGYDYDGEFLAIGTTVELTVGDVVLHVDDSSNSGVGVVVPGAKAPGAIVWIASADTSWAGRLAATSRELLALEPADRVRLAAREKVASLAPDADPVVRRHYEALAATGAPPVADALTDAIDAGIARVNAEGTTAPVDPYLRAAFMRAAGEPAFVAHYLARAGGKDVVDVPAMCARLSLTEERLAGLCLCRAPRPDRWDADLDAISGHVGCGRAALESVLADGGLTK